jgi:DNA-binding response OmpR family regulator
MERKKIVFIGESLEVVHKFKTVLSRLDVEVAAGSTDQLKNFLQDQSNFDLVVLEATKGASEKLSTFEQMLSEDGSGALLAVVNEEALSDLRLPIKVKSDFVVSSASVEECLARIRQLLWPGNESSSSDFITVENMTINLATYQVKVNGEPIDFTYLEYALLSFLVTHPGRTYSRDALLRRVWGFDYYGGSRTVDVHVRRVRSKLGPELSKRLKTIRSVGYLWNA